MSNHIRHGKDKRGDELPEELGHRETRLKEIPGGQRAVETRAREKAAAERGAPDQDKPKGKDQYNFTDPQSRIMPALMASFRGTTRRRQSKAARRALRNHSREAPNRVHPPRQKGREGNPSLRFGITSS
jgi:hypothetical protein